MVDVDFGEFVFCMQIKEFGILMMELWSLMEILVEEWQIFQYVICFILVSEDEISGLSFFLVEIIEEVCYILKFSLLLRF